MKLSRSAFPILALAFFVSGLFMSQGAAAGELDTQQMRQEALRLVNADRGKHGLGELRLEEELNAAAARHARDMHERSYFAHESPEGESVMDRYLEAGGRQWRLVTENISRCENCAPTVDDAALKRLQEGWMNSPEHRANILNEGLERFGFGVAASDAGGLYAVQTFSGPGRPRGLKADERTRTLDRGEQAAFALKLINEARKDAGVAPAQRHQALEPVSSAIAADGKAALDNDLHDMLPRQQAADWAALRVLYARCGGCGEAPTEADVRHFVGEWLAGGADGSPLLEETFTHLDLAVAANGEGRKDAVLVLGARR